MRSKIYEKGPVRYIHTFREDYNVVSISNLGRPVSEADWFYATEKFLKLDITDVEITITPREVVIIREKSESILRFAH
ncbi:hypothetical protein [Gracilibacillus sp. JCM 18860]|uniref:hypothetical protein n=1 Tax=Gracilibacillus sp. JCM 18860 TaxID=1306159 RepID=UPI000AEF6682